MKACVTKLALPLLLLLGANAARAGGLDRVGTACQSAH